MPNWTRSTIEIKGSKREIEPFMNSVQGTTINFKTLDIATEKQEVNNILVDNIFIKNKTEENILLEYEGMWGPPLEFFKKTSQHYPLLDFSIYFEEIENDKCGHGYIKNGQIDLVESSYNERFGVNFLVDKNVLIKEKDSVVISIISQQKKTPLDFCSNEMKEIVWRCEIPETCLEKMLEYDDFFEQSHITHDDNYKRISLNDHEIYNFFDFKDRLYKTINEEKDSLHLLFRQLHIEQSLSPKRKVIP